MNVFSIKENPEICLMLSYNQMNTLNVDTKITDSNLLIVKVPLNRKVLPPSKDTRRGIRPTLYKVGETQRAVLTDRSLPKVSIPSKSQTIRLVALKHGPLMST